MFILGAEDLMKLLLEYAIGFAVGLVCAVVFHALGVNFFVGLVLTFVVLVLVDQYRARRARTNYVEALQRQQSAIATYARELLETLDPPLPKEHSRAAFRRLCRAIAEGRTRVRLFTGDRTVEVILEQS
jgi:hypothetical protein